jgi:predicted GNAT family acetyltransferase/CBS domain-containing protein
LAVFVLDTKETVLTTPYGSSMETNLSRKAIGEVRDNVEQHRFELPIQGGAVAAAYYSIEDGRVVLTHTEVPAEFSGQGIATELAKGTFDLLRRSGRKAVLKCPFMGNFFARHPEYADVVAGWPVRGKSGMLVEKILPRACARLAVVDAAASIRDAAELMTVPHIDLVIVCQGGAAAGIVTKTDVIVHVSQGADLEAPVDSIMTHDIATCRVSDPLAEVWQRMKARNFQRMPVVDEKQVPIAIVYAPDAIQGLLQEVETDDELLRDFISGVGYH